MTQKPRVTKSPNSNKYECNYIHFKLNNFYKTLDYYIFRTVHGDFCEFPFEFESDTYYECVYDIILGFWCMVRGQLYQRCLITPTTGATTVTGKSCFPYNHGDECMYNKTIGYHCYINNNKDWEKCAMHSHYIRTRSGQECNFPFTYYGRQYYSCYYSSYYGNWCYTKTSGWDYCISLQNKNFKNSDKEECHFPFDYGGKTYTSCAYHAKRLYWCYTKDFHMQYCNYAPQRFRAIGNRECIFPFQYLNGIYIDCAYSFISKRHWCYVDHESGWDYCDLI